MGKLKNPKIIHRVYFENYPPFRDPFKRFLDTWKKELPDYEIKIWNAETFPMPLEVGWIKRSLDEEAPVFLSEYIRWKVLKEYGGLYLDADCEVLNGPKVHTLLEQLYQSDEYDAFVGVEERNNGFPTAQTVAAKPDSDLVDFMLNLYEGPLSSPLWHWKEERGFIGPQLISLYFRERGYQKDKGFFPRLESPIICEKVKIYTQDYFSPKFTTTGKQLNVSENTCIYHLFSNSNVKKVDPEREKHRHNPLLFKEYCDYLSSLPQVEIESGLSMRRNDGTLDEERIMKFAKEHPVAFLLKTFRYLRKKLNGKNNS